MDNLEQTTDPSGGADVTASQGQSDAIETQPVETTQPVDGGAEAKAGTASNPWDNDPKFKGKAPEDIYKAYKEAEKLTGQLSQKAQIANLIEEKYGVSPEQLKAQIEQQEYQQRQQMYANNPLLPVMDEVNQLKQIVQRQEQEKALAAEERKLDAFLKANPDYEAHRDKIFKLALTPGIGFDPNTNTEVPLEEIARDYFGQARAQGQKDAYKKIDTKVMTQATGASKGTPRTKITPEELDAMSHKDRIAAMEAMYPHADTSNRPY